MPDLPMSMTCSYDHALRLPTLIEGIVMGSSLCNVGVFESHTGGVDLKMLFSMFISMLLCYLAQNYNICRV